MGGVGSTNISFSKLREKYNEGDQNDADDDSGLQSEDDTSLSQFRTANFTDGTSVPAGSAAISIEDHFRSKSFGERR